MTRTAIDVHNGVRFQVEAVQHGEMFEGRFTILDSAHAGRGADDSFRPTIENRWSTATEALTYATEAAHHAIEGIPPFVDRNRGDDAAAAASHQLPP